MINRKFLISGCLLFAVIAAHSCKKDNNDSGDPRLVTANVVTTSGNLHYRMTYDGGNSVDSLILTGSGMSSGRYGYLKFVYYTLSYSVTNESNISFLTLVNKDGNITRLNVADTPSMLYENGRLAELDTKSPSATYPFIIKTSAYPQWTDGDITAIGYTGNIKRYAYDKNHKGQLGDALRIDDFLKYGRPILKSSHVPIAYIYNSDTAEKYLYQYDSQGRISQLSKVVITNTAANDTLVYTYGYY